LVKSTLKASTGKNLITLIDHTACTILLKKIILIFDLRMIDENFLLFKAFIHHGKIL